LTFSDWTDAESQSQYTKAAGGETATLWAEEWEDETEETDFSVQLKYLPVMIEFLLKLCF